MIARGQNEDGGLKNRHGDTKKAYGLCEAFLAEAFSTLQTCLIEIASLRPSCIHFVPEVRSGLRSQ